MEEELPDAPPPPGDASPGVVTAAPFLVCVFGEALAGLPPVGEVGRSVAVVVLRVVLS